LLNNNAPVDNSSDLGCSRPMIPLGGAGDVFADPDLIWFQLKSTNDSPVITYGASVDCTTELAPDDYVPTGDQLSTWIHVTDQCHMTCMLDVLARAKCPLHNKTGHF
jgi:hypothetical protein